MDDVFFTTERPSESKAIKLKRGRGSQKKTKILVMAESKEVTRKTTKQGKPRKVGYLKMQVIKNLKAETITNKVKKVYSKKQSY